MMGTIIILEQGSIITHLLQDDDMQHQHLQMWSEVLNQHFSSGLITIEQGSELIIQGPNCFSTGNQTGVGTRYFIFEVKFSY